MTLIISIVILIIALYLYNIVLTVNISRITKIHSEIYFVRSEKSFQVLVLEGSKIYLPFLPSNKLLKPQLLFSSSNESEATNYISIILPALQKEASKLHPAEIMSAIKVTNTQFKEVITKKQGLLRKRILA
jgi:hypothetical protein